MQQSSINPRTLPRGGRISSQELRASINTQEEPDGLADKVDRYHLLKLVERVGKGAGFTPRMVDLLSYYLRFTRETDWEEGSRPIVYQSLSKTALDFGISERQIQKLENALFEAGALTWHDSGNYRRFGQRCPKSGKILYAYGVELTPLAELEERLTELLEEKEAHARAWMETKRQVSFYRRQIKALTAEAQEMPSIFAGGNQRCRRTLSGHRSANPHSHQSPSTTGVAFQAPRAVSSDEGDGRGGG
ncbi:MAG: replication initiation protein RepC [Akkermansiaceae bacterium]|jgi:replication initiation protein RepC